MLLAARLWYPDDAALARNDFLTIAAVVIQIVMVVARLETLRELRVIVLFHLVGTGMELFKTAVGSYMVRSVRVMDLAFDRYPPRWVTAIVAVLIYANFFGHHYIYDFRRVLLLAVAVVWLRPVIRKDHLRCLGHVGLSAAGAGRHPVGLGGGAC